MRKVVFFTPNQSKALFEINKPYFTIRLYEDVLKMDLKGKTRNELEEALENKPVLKETIGRILSIFVPLHICLSDIESVKMDKTGKVKLILPRHRDITIPLEPKEAKKLANHLNELIPQAKQKRIQRVIQKRKLEKTAEEEQKMERAAISLNRGRVPVQPTIPPPPGVLIKMSEAEEEIEKQEEEKQED